MVGRQTGKTKKLAGRIQRSLARRQKQQTARQASREKTWQSLIQSNKQKKESQLFLKACGKRGKFTTWQFSRHHTSDQFLYEGGAIIE